MRPTATNADWQNSIRFASTVFVGAVIVAALYWAQDILIPIALAVFLTFVLSPVVNALCRIGLHRVLAVVVVIAGLGLVLTGFGAAVTIQSGNLLQELPEHSATIRQRIKSVKTALVSDSSKRFQRFVDDVWKEVESDIPTPLHPAPLPEEDPAKATAESEEPEESETAATLTSFLPIVFSSTASALGTLAMTLVLAAFMLVKREDLRDRFLRLIGDDRIAAATKGMDDAGRRISRYLFTQFLINAAYGLIFGAALALIGVPYAGLWGGLAGVMRYIPYLGPWMASIAPLLLSLATTATWTQPLLTLALILVIELILNNVVEPMLYGSSIGVSQVAFIVFAAFWAFLWGAIGLVLSAPLTVILLVLGQRVPQLSALNVLLGEDTPLQRHVRFFQRLIANDQDEATKVLAERIQEDGPVQACDEILLPALSMLVECHRTGEIQDADVQRANQCVEEILDDLLDPDASLESSEDKETERRPRLRLIPVDSDTDIPAILALKACLDPEDWKIEVPPNETLLAELIDWVQQEPDAIVCVVGLSATGQAHPRYICKRLLAQEGTKRILVGRLGDPETAQGFKDSYQNLGVKEMTTTLAQTLQTIASWHAIVASQQSSTEPEEALSATA